MTGQPVRAGSTLSGLSLRVLARHPDRVAFSWEGGEITYAQTLDLIARFQSVYAAHGLVRGKRLALLAGNRVEAWCAGVAAQANGLSLTPLHPIGSLDDHLYQVSNAEADALVVDVPRHAARGAELAAQAGVGVFFTLGQADYGIDLLAAAQDAGAVTARDLAQADDLAFLNYTGGTTGRPKGVLTRHVAAAARPGAVLGAFEVPDNPTYLAVAPISHVTGQKIVPTLFKGGRVHLMNGFSSRGVLDTIARERINMALMVPTMIYGLLDDPDLDTADLSSLELLLYGASPMSPSRLIEGMQRIGPVFSQLYGQSECYPISVLSKADHDPANPERFGSCGVPVPGVDVRLLNEDGSEVAQGEPGEICVR
ncbi:MAG: AMP-binding protein, partial [Phenylobacterium sp.]|uniref:AMP-binding protein n=1 Tax=Phenylobacterium sp. TaxID=1871053 RepID=UPI002733BC8F